jgi:hypothetical protein
MAGPANPTDSVLKIDHQRDILFGPKWRFLELERVNGKMAEASGYWPR